MIESDGGPRSLGVTMVKILIPSFVILFVLCAASCIESLGAATGFSPEKDLLSLHYDHAPDKDDGQSAAADRTILVSLFGIDWIKSHVVPVSGAYGKNAGKFNTKSDVVMDVVWTDCGGWLGAHTDRAHVINEMSGRWITTLNAGGDIWIKEGGQSDITADVVKQVRSRKPDIDTAGRIHVVQHSKWNEIQTTDSALAFTRQHTHYIKIRDANAYLNIEGGDMEFVRAAQNHPIFGSGWRAAFEYYDPDHRLDFSDTGELMHILGLGEMGVDDFRRRFLTGSKGERISQFEVEKSLDVAEVPAGFPVNFCLLTAGERQYVAYFDKDRCMTVASRMLDSDQWQYQVLPSRVGWDTHNYITMAVDDHGHLHVSGNMHCVPLIYFRTERAGEIATLKKLAMTGEQEDRVTYPKFLTDHEGTLIFTYRNGGSGNGRRFYNKYDPAAPAWSRLLDEPLLDGEGERNAYPLGPVRGPDGWFHIVWVWRDTPDCATNHHLSHVRSRDLIHWESYFGQKVELPMRLSEKQLWVDPIPSGGGIINGCEKLAFDADHRPIITYHKSDSDGYMQIYAARAEEGRWVKYLLTDWNKPVEFSGYGSMGFIGISVSGLDRRSPGVFSMTYRHRDYGRGRLVLDEKTLRPINKEIEIVREYPRDLDRVQGDFEGLEIRRAGDIGRSGDSAVRYILQWETLGRNRDRPRKPPLPGPSLLRLHKLVTKDYIYN